LEIPENPGNRPRKIVHFGGVYKRLQPETPKKPLNFPPEIRGKFPEIPGNPGNPGNPENSGNSGNSGKYYHGVFVFTLTCIQRHVSYIKYW
jgi:hypothetical protein